MLEIVLFFIAYLSVGFVLGWAWARFMPEWDRKVDKHEKGCRQGDYLADECSYSELRVWRIKTGGCRCLRRPKPLSARENDFWCIFLLWPPSIALASLFLLCLLAERAINRIGPTVQAAVRKIVTWP
jgi:hypothetical protein